MRREGPRVTIGVPVYNGENYLAEALASILSQSYTDFRLILSDNASTDATPEICAKFARADARVEYLRSDMNLGATPNFNRVLERAESEYFKWAAHDDLLAPNFLARCVARLDAESSLVACHAWSECLDAEGRRLGTYDHELPLDAPRASDRFFRTLWVDHFTEIWAVFRTSALRRAGGLGGFVGADRNLLADVLLQGGLAYEPDYLFFRRSHAACFCNSLANDADRLRWFDTSARGGAAAAARAKTAHYLKSLAQRDLGWAERARCLRHLLHWGAVRGSQKLGRRRDLEAEQRDLRRKLGLAPTRAAF